MKTKTPLTELYLLIAGLQTPAEVSAFFADLCTPAELQAMADRWQVVHCLQQGLPYREIYEATGVSLTTISRVARSLHFGTGGYQLMYDRMKNHVKNRIAKKR